MGNKKKKTTRVEDAIKEYNRIISHSVNHNIIDNNSIINSKNSIYDYSPYTPDGKRPNKRTCIYYDKINKKCNNSKCSKVYCDTASNCTCYRRRK